MYTLPEDGAVPPNRVGVTKDCAVVYARCVLLVV